MKEERNINIDLIKCIAVFFVIGVHFFNNSGFNYIKINSVWTLAFIVIRILLLICVPLFMITTGYLMKNKEISKSYYFGMIRTYFIYLIVTSFILLYFILYTNRKINTGMFIQHLLKFDVGYCWYIKMYLGMFLFMPFLNILYNNIKTKKTKLILIITMICVTIIPVFLNTDIALVPDWWITLYPITYYYVGCYIREYKIKISTLKISLIAFAFLVLGVIDSIVRSYGNFLFHSNTLSNLYVFGMAVAVFILIINLDLSKTKTFIKKIIIKISKLSLGIYLASALTDDLLYKHIFKGNELYTFKYFFIIVPLSFIMSLIISYVADIIYNVIDKLIIQKIKNRILNGKKKNNNSKKSGK